MEAINVNKFIEDYNKTTNETFRGNVIKGIMKNTTLGIAEKTAFAKTIAKKTCLTPEGKYELNTVAESFYFTIDLLKEYTNLEIGENVVEVYDVLDKADALLPIIKAIPEKEYNELRQLADLGISDYIANHGSPLSQIVDTINALYSSIGELANNFTEEEKAKIIELVSARIGKGE